MLASTLHLRFHDASGSLKVDPQTHPIQGKAFERVVAAAQVLLRELGLDDARELTLDGETLSVDGQSQRRPAREADAVLAVALRELGLGAEDEAARVVDDARFWQSRYETQDTGWDLGEPAPPLVHALEQLEPQRAIVVGCGKGHEVLAMARRGFDVTGVDFAAGAVAFANAALAKAKLAGAVLERDVFTLPGELAPFPLWVEHTCFCAIDPARRGEYVDAAARTLEPGGTLLALFYAHGRPGGPPFSTTRDELERLFSEKFALQVLRPATDSHPRRRGEELLGIFRRR